MSKLFGTDGVRGVAGTEITPELAMELSKAAADVIFSKKKTKLKVIVGNDSRISAGFLTSAICAGFASVGANITNVGIIPTPGLAYLTVYDEYDLGVMISASHNPMEDNGIKFFGPNGYKLSDIQENEIENIYKQLLSGEYKKTAKGIYVGKIINDNLAVAIYIEYLINSASQKLIGQKIVLDCANGATSAIAQRVFERLGAKTIVIGNNPNGTNINFQCGSMHPERLQESVIENKANIGFAFDGDGDRCIAVNQKGELIDGDKILGILAIDFKKKNNLSKNTLVTTVMSNIGLHIAMKNKGIKTVSTQVGDRYVLEEMLKNGSNLGGEQSGHIILSDYSTTGDGLLTAINISSIVKDSKKQISQLSSEIVTFPQILINVKNVNKLKLNENKIIQTNVKRFEKELGKNGRILLRASGTEPVIRVMVEAQTKATAYRIAINLKKIITKELSI